MAKSTLSFVCQNCGAAYNRWQGKCESCGEWNTLVEEDTTGATSMPVSIRSRRKGRTFKLESLTGKSQEAPRLDRKSTRLNSSHSQISYAVFCLKKKKQYRQS